LPAPGIHQAANDSIKSNVAKKSAPNYMDVLQCTGIIGGEGISDADSRGLDQTCPQTYLGVGERVGPSRECGLERK